MPNVWVDGCFDLGHFGHGNLIRQARELAGPDGEVIIGVHSDEEIEKNKRKPIFTQKERINMVEALKWGDKVVPDAPYVTTINTIRRFGCNFAVHGSDITSTLEGEDCYSEVKDAGLYVEVKRTQGISTSKLINRVLKSNTNVTAGSYTGSNFMMSSKMVKNFDCRPSPNDGEVIIYVCGSFDLFHPGHVDFLRSARCRGDYLIVGLYDDATVRRLKGEEYPMMTLNERAMTVLSNKYVQEVIIGAPYSVTEELMTYFNVNLVVYGSHPVLPDVDGEDPYLVPASMGKLIKINSFNPLTTEDVVDRIKSREKELVKSNEEKELKEAGIIIEKIIGA